MIIENRGLLWSVDHSLSPEEKFVELTRLVFDRYSDLLGPVSATDLKCAAEARITYEDAKKFAVYPPELELAAREFHGSAGENLNVEDYDLPAGQVAFEYSFFYPEKRTVRTQLNVTVRVEFFLSS